jgi:hypothetical protein
LAALIAAHRGCGTGLFTLKELSAIKRLSWVILFWGSVWGLTEATLGYLIHLAALPIPGLPGLLMFPVAFFFMKKAYDAGGKMWAVFYAAAVAAAIKLTDLFLPGLTPIFVVNPAVAIILEGLAVGLIMHYRSVPEKKLSYLEVLAMPLLWRAVFLCDQYIISQLGLPAGLVTNGPAVALKFLLWESLINSLLIYAFLSKPFAIRVKFVEIKPAYACLALLIALGVQRLV